MNNFNTTKLEGEVATYNQNGWGLVVIECDNYSLKFQKFHLTCFHSRPVRLPIKGEQVEIVYCDGNLLTVRSKGS